MFFSVNSAVSAVPAVSVAADSSSAVTSSGGQPAAPEDMKCESPEVSYDPEPLESSVPPQVLPDPSQAVVVPGEVLPEGGRPDLRQNVVVPGEVLPVGGLQDSMQRGVNSGEVPPGNNVAGPVQVGVGHGEVPPVSVAPVGGEPVGATPGGRRRPPPGVVGIHPPMQFTPLPSVSQLSWDQSRKPLGESSSIACAHDAQRVFPLPRVVFVRPIGRRLEDLTHECLTTFGHSADAFVLSADTVPSFAVPSVDPPTAFH